MFDDPQPISLDLMSRTLGRFGVINGPTPIRLIEPDETETEKTERNENQENLGDRIHAATSLC